MKECAKASIRRQSDPAFARHFLVGAGLDVLGGNDPLTLYLELFPRITGVRVWNTQDGDPQALTGVPDASYDFVHSCYRLGLFPEPQTALANWFRVVKPGGHLIVTVPDEDLYEQGVFPSSFNREHKWSFTVHKAKSFHGRSLNVIELALRLGPAADLRRLAVIDAGYRERLPRMDQTLSPVGECAIEFVLRKRTEAELAFGGATPRRGKLTADDLALLTGFRSG